jgi:hypothetical protein
LVRPTPENAPENGHYYRATTIWSPPTFSSDTEPNWPTSTGACVIEFKWIGFDLIMWCEFQTMTSGSSQPAWPTGDSQIVFDYYVTWQEDTNPPTSDFSQPTWRTDNVPFVDNSVIWVRSMVYKMIRVYVTPPGCNNDTCAYIAASIITGKDYATRP